MQFLWILIIISSIINSSFSFFTTFTSKLERLRELLSIYDTERYTRNLSTDELIREYDFIVIGAGSGGSTITNRLTEISNWSVLLLEAGGEEKFITDIPLMMSHMQLTSYSWGYRAQPQDNACLGLNDHRSMWPQGKGMGGTSIINGMMYTRGHPKDFDDWEKLGNYGWSYKDVMPYFIKSERAKGDFQNNTKFHGKTGYLSVENLPYKTPLINAFLESAYEVGYSLVDHNSDNIIGFSRIQTTTRNGRRCSASKAFLRPIRKRKNLYIAQHSHVTKILINPYTYKAYGVQFYRNGLFWKVYARKEIIISAGAINTPQLLMLSGIGPKDHLKSFGIPVIKDLPGVGQNLQDHITMPGLSFLINQTISVNENRLLFDVSTILNYLVNHNGMLTLIGGVEGIGYIRTSGATTPSDYPNIELIFASAHLGSDDGRVVRKVVGMTDEVYNAVYKPINNRDAWTIWPMLIQSNARGWVKLKSKNPFKSPIMIGNYLKDEQDVKTLVEGIKFAIEISKTKAFQRYNSTLHNIPLPACEHINFATDNYWECVVRQITNTLHHFCGTAKMGRNTDSMAVVSPELKVHGINNLRIVDTSIIPLIPAGHTNAIAYMIGEKAADMIKCEHDKKP